MKKGEIDRYVRDQRSILEGDKCKSHFGDKIGNILKEEGKDDAQQYFLICYHSKIEIERKRDIYFSKAYN